MHLQVVQSPGDDGSDDLWDFLHNSLRLSVNERQIKKKKAMRIHATVGRTDNRDKNTALKKKNP